MKAKGGKNGKAMRAEYRFDYSTAVRGKYCKSLRTAGANIVMLDPDVAKSFPDSSVVNDVLRSLLDFTKSTQRLTSHSRRRTAVRR